MLEFRIPTANVMRETGWVVGPQVAAKRFAGSVLATVTPEGAWEVKDGDEVLSGGTEDSPELAALAALDFGSGLPRNGFRSIKTVMENMIGRPA